MKSLFASMIVVGLMKFLYACILVVGLFLLIKWSPYSDEYDPSSVVIDNSGVAACELFNHQQFILSAVLVGLSITGLVRESTISGMRKMIEPAAPLSLGCMRFFYASLLAVGLILRLAWPLYRATAYPPPVDLGTLKVACKLANVERSALFAVLIGLPIIGLVRESKINKMRKGVEPDAPPNGGPATPLDNSGVTEGPPSVS